MRKRKATFRQADDWASYRPGGPKVLVSAHLESFKSKSHSASAEQKTLSSSAGLKIMNRQQVVIDAEVQVFSKVGHSS